MRAAGSLAARVALDALYRYTFGKQMPKIITDAHGKPRLSSVTEQQDLIDDAHGKPRLNSVTEQQDSIDDAHGKPSVTCINNAQDSTIDNSFDKATDRIHISISHTDSYAAAVISDEGEVGIDIEQTASEDVAHRIDRRYLRNVSFNLHNIKNCVQFYILDASESGNPCKIIELDRGVYGETDTSKSAASDSSVVITDTVGSDKLATARFEYRWTTLEAVLKADGRGFGAYPEIERIMPEYESASFNVVIGNDKLFLSVAIRRQEL